MRAALRAAHSALQLSRPCVRPTLRAPSALAQQARLRSSDAPQRSDDDSPASSLELSHFLEAFVDPYEVDPNLPPPGRRWSASEIRLKSDDDLQKLWVVLMRERNMLYSVKMMHEKRKTSMPYPERLRMTRKSMAMIKRVLGERDRAAAAARERGDLLSNKQRKMLSRSAQDEGKSESGSHEAGGHVASEAGP